MKASRHASLLFALGALALVFVFGAIFNGDGAFFLPYTHASTQGHVAGFAILANGHDRGHPDGRD
jgi:hypothetical protein